MLDDPARAARLRAEPRADLSLGQRMLRFAEAMQERITREVERLDGRTRFREERWERMGEGSGRRRVIEGGAVFARGVVSTESVHSTLGGGASAEVGAPSRTPLSVTGLALALHPVNPHAPSVRAHFRHVALGLDPLRPDDQWFGGGAGLAAPSPFDEDAEGFLRVWEDVCRRHSAITDYAAFKANGDQSFPPLCAETQSVGLLYEGLRDPASNPGQAPEAAFLFTRDAARAFLASYLPIVERRKDTPYGAREREAGRHSLSEWKVPLSPITGRPDTPL